MNLQRTTWAAIGGLLVLTASAQAVTPPPGSATKEVDAHELKLQKKPLGNMRSVHALGNIYLAGQPTPTDIPLLKKAGIKTVITLRKTKEVPWDEAGVVKQQGMKFVSIPFQGPAELKPEVFDKALKVLRDKKRGPTVLHCGSANRVGAIWYAYRVLDGKLLPEAALKEAKVVGLRTPGYVEKAQAYVVEVQSRPPIKKP